MTPAVLAELRRVQHVVKLADDLDYEDELLAHWARYLCVVVCGLVERCVAAALSDYADRAADPRVAAFTKLHLSRSNNLNEERLKQLLGSFSPEWRQGFEQNVTEAHKSALDSLVTTRNNIAHGRSVGITLARVRDYLSRVTEVIGYVDDLCA